MGRNEAQHRKFKRLKLGGGQHTIVQVSKLPQKIKKFIIFCCTMPGLIDLECKYVNTQSLYIYIYIYKVVPLLFLTENHAMKAYWGVKV
jgi:hypothetical protein